MTISETVMQKLYGANIWEDFSPEPAESEVQGWNGNAPSLARIAGIPGPKIIVDVGVWKGQSTIAMAKAMRDNGIDGVIIAVDTFLGSPEHWADKTLFQRRNGLPNLYQIFMSNVYNAGVTNYVIPMAQTSSTAAKIIGRAGIQASIVHVDAAHEYREAIQDIEDYWSLLQSGGFMIGDDYDVNWPGVIKAAGEFSARIGRPLTIEWPKFIMQKA